MQSITVTDEEGLDIIYHKLMEVDHPEIKISKIEMTASHQLTIPILYLDGDIILEWGDMERGKTIYKSRSAFLRFDNVESYRIEGSSDIIEDSLQNIEISGNDIILHMVFASIHISVFPLKAILETDDSTFDTVDYYYTEGAEIRFNYDCFADDELPDYVHEINKEISDSLNN